MQIFNHPISYMYVFQNILTMYLKHIFYQYFVLFWIYIYIININVFLLFVYLFVAYSISEHITYKLFHPLCIYTKCSLYTARLEMYFLAPGTYLCNT